MSLVVINGGEKAADAAASLGFVATCNAGGEAAIGKTNWSQVDRFDTVAIVEDNDDAGSKFGHAVAAILKRQRPSQTIKTPQGE